MEDEIKDNNDNQVNVEQLLQKLNESEKEKAELREKTTTLEEQVGKLNQTREGLLTDLNKFKSRFNEQQSLAENEEEQKLLKQGDYQAIIESKVKQALERETNTLKEALNNTKREKEEFANKYVELENKIKHDKVRDYLTKQALSTDIQPGAAKYLVDEALKHGKITEDGGFAWNEKYNKKGEDYGFKDFTSDFINKNPDQIFLFKNIEGNDVKQGRKTGVKELTQKEWNKKLSETTSKEAKAQLLKDYADGKFEII